MNSKLSRNFGKTFLLRSKCFILNVKKKKKGNRSDGPGYLVALRSHPSASLPVDLVLPFLAPSWMCAGSVDPLLYHHRARCSLGASRVAFISAGCTDAGLRGFAGRGTGSYFTAARLSLSRFRVCWGGYGCMNMCGFMSWRLCEGSDPQKGPSGYSGGLSLQRAAGRRDAGQPPRRGGNPVCGGASLGRNGG